MAGLTKAQSTFLAALAEHGRLSAAGTPPVAALAKAGLINFVHRSEDFSVLEITPAGRQALSQASSSQVEG